MNALTIILIIATILMTIPVWYKLFITKNDAKKAAELNDKQYWELKYRIQSLVTVFSILIAVFVVLGLDTISSIEKTVIAAMQPKVDSINVKYLQTKDSLNIMQKLIQGSYKDIETKITGYSTNLERINNYSKNVSGLFSKTTQSMTSIEQRIQSLNSKNILKKEIYIVNDESIAFVNPDSLIRTSNDSPLKKIFFKGLKTTSEDYLPEFKKTPVVLAFSNDGSTYRIKEVTRQYVIVSLDTHTGGVKKVQPILYINEQ